MYNLILKDKCRFQARASAGLKIALKDVKLKFPAENHEMEAQRD